MYPATSLTICLGRLGIVLLVGLSYPLQLLPCRACIHGLTGGFVNRYLKKRPSQAGFSQVTSRVINGDASDDDDDDQQDGDEGSDAENDALVPKPGDSGFTGGVRSKRAIGEMTQRKYIGVTLMILFSGFAIALLVDELEVGKSLS